MAVSDAVPALDFVGQLPLLVVAVPLLAAPVCVLIGNRNVAWVLAGLSSLASFIFSIHLLMQVLDGSTISYAVGGWAPPLGIEYRIDAANASVLMLISGISTLVLV